MGQCESRSVRMPEVLWHPSVAGYTSESGSQRDYGQLVPGADSDGAQFVLMNLLVAGGLRL